MPTKQVIATRANKPKTAADLTENLREPAISNPLPVF